MHRWFDCPITSFQFPTVIHCWQLTPDVMSDVNIRCFFGRLSLTKCFKQSESSLDFVRSKMSEFGYFKNMLPPPKRTCKLSTSRLCSSGIFGIFLSMSCTIFSFLPSTTLPNRNQGMVKQFLRYDITFLNSISWYISVTLSRAPSPVA